MAGLAISGREGSVTTEDLWAHREEACILVHRDEGRQQLLLTLLPSSSWRAGGLA